MASTSDAKDVERMTRELIKGITNINWEDVVKIYEQDPRAHKIKLGKSGNTALHMAVASKKEDIVEQLVKLINERSENALEVLSIKGGGWENNPLHLAASLGSIPMCKCIIGDKHKQLLGTRNCISATPMFMAVYHGKKDAFLWLYKMCADNPAQALVYCHASRGITALHIAITNGYSVTGGKIVRKSNKQLDVEKIEEGQGSREIRTLKEIKETHIWSVQIMNKLLEHAVKSEPQNDETSEINTQMRTKAFYTPILAATVNGVIEMVEKILQEFPMTIHDWDSTRKNIVLVAVESRQSHIYDFLLRRRSDVVDKDLAFHERDEKGNSALHIAAGLQNSRGWFIPTSMLQLQWEVKWFEYVKNTLPPDFCIGTNIYRKTALQIFTETHGQLLDKSKEWLNNTCNSCSFIAALISTVAFASSATVPGGVDQDTGEPIFQHHLAFRFFAISSLVALCSSFISLLFFFAILTSKYDYKDFSYNLPWNIILGLTSLFVSMAAMLVCFCSGHFLMLDDHLKYPAIPVYALTLWAVTYFALQQSSSYFILLRATFKKVPQRMYPQDPL
uniref:PGG domain-containing protein n=1 Tax=Vitis vinifera TaxID=29760 RepID=A5BIW9_VITVI|nr:hypothetical protein VITISV_014969 [Vitis vinifera]